MSATIKLFGVKELQRKLESFPKKLQRKMLRSAMTKAGRIVAATAKNYVPVATGALRKSIKVTGLQGGRGAGLSARAGGKSAPIGKRVRASMPYAHIIEKGRKNQRARPFLAPALYNNAEKVRALIRDDVERQMKEMVSQKVGG